MSAPSRRILVRSLVDSGLTERHALRVVGMSASAYRYQPAPDRNEVLRTQIIELATYRQLIDHYPPTQVTTEIHRC